MTAVLQFLFAAAVTYTVSATCPDGFEHHGNNCYKASSLEASWIEAKMYCRTLGTDLLIIHDAAEETIVEGILARLHGSHIDERYWLDGTDIVAEKDWRWMGKDGMSRPIVSSANSYTNWGANAPNNAGGQENCLQVVYTPAPPTGTIPTVTNSTASCVRHRSYLSGP